ncbi:MAG: response regulator [Prolixibacteraceae bacterium]|nr:response regulator [Prolixibacteraceae bacterium]
MRKIILLILFISSSIVTYANNELLLSSLFENYNVSNGLTDEKIHCCIQDSKGWIWIGTDYGILRFDGYDFTPFQIMNETGNILQKTLIRKIFEDERGNIWIGTDFQGLFKYSRDKNTLTQFKSPESLQNTVWDIIKDSNNKLCLGTEGGLTHFNPETEQFELSITKKTSKLLPGTWVRKLFIDKSGRLWVGADKGIAVLNSNNTLEELLLNADSYKDRENEIWEIYQDNDGTIWVGTYLGGLLKYNTQSKTLDKVILDKSNLRSSTVRAIAQDKNDNLWFGTRGGLYNLNATTGETHHYKNDADNRFSLIHNSVLDLMIDKKGDLWVGTRNGLSYLNFDKQAFGYLSSKQYDPNKLNNGDVYVLWEDGQNKLWIGTENGGINIYDPQKKTIEYITVKDGLSKNCIKAICPDNKGNVLIGTYLGGLNIYNPRTGDCKVFLNDPKDPKSISHNEVWAIVNDSKNRIWIGTSKGLDLFDEEKQTFSHYESVGEMGYASMIYEDRRGDLWVFSADKEKVFFIKPFNSYKVFDIQSRAICEDINGNIWMGTLGQGLLKMNSEHEIVANYTIDDGLPNNVLNGLINVNNESLWISSNNGLSKFMIATEEFRNYYSSDGLLNNKFNYGAFQKTQNNSLVFGGKKGVDFVFLDKISRNNYVPPIVITGFRIFNKEVAVSLPGQDGLLTKHISETKEIVLNYDQNMISFDFAALNYTNSQKNKYKYMLEGFDKEWNDIGTSRRATYTNLDHGEYVFKVIGSNNDNVYNEKGAEVAVTIEPPLWKTNWFRILSIFFLLVIVFVVFLMVRNREKLKQELIYERQTAHKVKEIDRLKHQFFMNVSHEIRTPLSLIMGPLDKIMSMNIHDNAVSTNLNLIKRNTVNLEKLVNQLLDYRKLETGNVKNELKKGNLKVFIENIIETFRFTAEDKGISLVFKSDQPICFTWFDEEKIEKILNNLISNAIKYSRRKGEVSISLSSVFADDIVNSNLLIPPLDAESSKYKKYIKIKVTDTGIGIAPDDLPKIFDRFRRIRNNSEVDSQGIGIGLALTKELVKIHDGHLRVRSQIGKGSRFSVFIPFYDENLQADEGEIGEVVLNEAVERNDNDENNNINKNRAIILVVDDNQDLRSFIRSHFEPEYNIIEAKQGKDGWKKSLENVPDIVISDVMMPVMNGNELCRKLKKDERTSHIPVIMLSALGSSENQLAGIDAGADDYLTKPFDIGLLKAKVDNIFSIRKSLRERYSKQMVLKPKDVILTSPDEKFLKKLIGIVEKNIANENLDVEFLAKNMLVSRTQLYRKIGALTDMSPKEFVRELRLNRAAQIIGQNKMNISEVAYSVGFCDVAYFRKCFKEKFGVSASSYKKAYLAEN